jgi:HK97 family phage major capsid protein
MTRYGVESLAVYGWQNRAPRMNTAETRARLAEKVDAYELLLRTGNYSQARAASLKGEVDRLESQLRAQTDFETKYGGGTATIERSAWMPEEQRKQVDNMERAAFDFTLRGLQMPRQLRTYAALTDTTTAGGAFLVPQSVGEDVNLLVKSYGPLLKYVNAFTTTHGGKISYTTLDATAIMGSFINENDPTTAQDTNTNGVYGGMLMASRQWQSGIILASNALVQDTAFALSNLILKEASSRAARGFVDLCTNGDGSTTGFLNVASTGSVTQATPTAILWSEIIDLEGAVDAGYAERGAYCFNFATYRKLRKLQISGVNQWEAAEFSQGRINNHPYFINNAMPDIGSGKKSVGFGDWTQVLFRQVGSMSIAVLKEIYQGNLSFGYLANQRVESIVQQPTAIAFLKGA